MTFADLGEHARERREPCRVAAAPALLRTHGGEQGERLHDEPSPERGGGFVINVAGPVGPSRVVTRGSRSMTR
jgi:hypothetical protein